MENKENFFRGFKWGTLNLFTLLFSVVCALCVYFLKFDQ